MANSQILLVEDSSTAALFARKLLNDLGYDVPAIVPSGEEAVRKAEEIRPDLILMDIELAGKMDGVEAAGQIYSHFDIPIVFLTSKSDEKTLFRAKNTEAYGYIHKPVELKELRAAIEVALFKAGMERKLKENQQWLATTLASIGDAVIATDENGNIKFMNPIAEALTAWRRKEALGKTFKEIMNIVDEDSLCHTISSKMLKELYKGNVFDINNHTLLVARDGNQVPIEGSAAPIRDDKGSITGGVIVFRDITARRQAEEKLKSSEERLKILFEFAPDAYYLHDLQGKYIGVNRAVEELIGYKREFLIGKNFLKLNLLHPDYIRKATINLAKNVLGNPTGPDEFVFKRNDGNEIIVETRTFPVKIEGKALVLGLARDITQRKQAEDALKQSEERLKSILDHLQTGIVIVDAITHKIIDVNPMAITMIGAARKEIVGRECHKYICPAERGECPISDLGHKVENSEQVLITANGEKIDVLKTVIPITLYENQYFVESFIDITERKKAEQALREEHAQKKQLLASMPSILIGLNQENKISHWNIPADTAFGLSEADVMGKSFLDCNIQWDWNEITSRISKSRAKGLPVRLNDFRYTRADGREGFLNVTINPFLSDAGEESGFLLLGADITEHKIFESELVQSQKLESIGQLAAGIAHEINTPTQYVGDNARFLQEAFNSLSIYLEKCNRLVSEAGDKSFSPELVKDIEKIQKDKDLNYLLEEIPIAIQQSLEGIDRVTKIVGAMKEFSHPDVKEKSSIDINRAIESTITVSRNEWKYVADMETDFDPQLPPVLCLPGEFNQVILNLVINAAHAIEKVIGDGSTGKGKINVSTRSNGKWVEIRIKDTGSGIPQDIRQKIFDPFFTTKEVGKGTGQGLVIARSVIVDQHGGTITFETEEGKGTTFIVRLPKEDSDSNKVVQ